MQFLHIIRELNFINLPPKKKNYIACWNISKVTKKVDKNIFNWL